MGRLVIRDCQHNHYYSCRNRLSCADYTPADVKRLRSDQYYGAYGRQFHKGSREESGRKSGTRKAGCHGLAEYRGLDRQLLLDQSHAESQYDAKETLINKPIELRG